MQSQRHTEFNPVNLLIEHIRQDNKDKFIELFEFFQTSESTLQFKLDQTAASLLLYPMALFCNRKEIFEYLVKSNFSVKVSNEMSSSNPYASYYIQGLIQLLQRDDTLADVEYWLTILKRHQHLLTFDINLTHDDVSLLQIICLLPTSRLQLIIKSGLLQKIIDMGAKPNIQFNKDAVKNEKRTKAIEILISIPELKLTPAVLEMLLIAFTRAGNDEMVRKFLIRMTGKDVEAQNANAMNDITQAQNKLLFSSEKRYDPKSDKGKEEIDFVNASSPISDEAVIPNLNARDHNKRTALSYAAESNNIDIVKLLLAYGASPLSAVHYAINNRHVEMTQFLIQHGGAIFTALPYTITYMNINYNDCYVEGMTIDGKPVTKETSGFMLAIHDAESLREYKARQDAMHLASFEDGVFTPSFRNFVLPLHSIKNALNELENLGTHVNDSGIVKAHNIIRSVNNVSSLAFLARNGVRLQRNSCEIFLEEKVVSLAEYLEKIDPKIAAVVFDRHPDKLKAIAILNERLDELDALRIHMIKTYDSKKNSQNRMDCLAATSCHASYSLPSLYAFYSVFAFCGDACCNCCGSHASAGPGIQITCDAGFVSKYAMYFFGIPGLVILGLVTTAIGVIIALKCIYGDQVSFCQSRDFNPKVEDYPAIHAALLALGKILTQEKLPSKLARAVQIIQSANPSFSDCIYALVELQKYYENSEIKNIRDELSTTPYHSYQDGLFFWTPAQRAANRSVKLPSRLEMSDENFDIQHGHGFEMFTMMEEGTVTEDEALPVSITMTDDDIKSPVVDETTPLFINAK